MQRRQLQQHFDELRNEQKQLGKQIGPLQGALKKSGFAGDVSIMTSGGGVVSAAEARSKAANKDNFAG